MHRSFLVVFMVCGMAWTHIDAAVDLQLVGHRRIIVVFDSYEGYARENNLVHAACLVKASQNIALSMPDLSIDVGFEDPAVYDMGNLLKDHVHLLEPYLHRHEKDSSYFSMIPSPKTPGHDEIMVFGKPKKLTTFLAGDLTRALAITPSWPDNLIIHSNDPRHEHYLALIKNETWLKDNAKHIRMKNLITAAPLLEARRLMFTIDSSLQQKEKITKFINDFADLEQQRLVDFANYASIKSKNEITSGDLGKSLHALLKDVPLSVVHEFLMQAKQRTDYYSDGPLVDVYLTMLKEIHPDIMIVVLGNHLAKKLVQQLNDWELVEQASDIKDAANWLLQVAQGKASLPSYD